MPIGKRVRRQGIAWSLATGLAIGLGVAGQAASAQTAEAGTTVYGPEAFADTAPATAHDMLQRLPGFTIIEADADVRGYAGALGNVLIDGARPASKRDDIGDLLLRIPAAGVERIELIRSGGNGVDMAGYPVLANVVRRRASAPDWAIEAGVLVSTDGWIQPGLKAEYARRWGETALELSFRAEPELDDDSGTGRIVETTAEGTLVEASALDTFVTQREIEAAAVFRHPLGGGQLTTSAALRSESIDGDTMITDSTSGADDEIVVEDEDYAEAEVGVRFARSLGDRHSLEVMLTRQLGRLDAVEREQTGTDSDTFSELTDTGETIARIELGREQSETLAFTAGLEGAFNFLESRARLEENGLPVDLPGSDVRIEERRGEASVGAIWKLAGGWRVDAGLRVEASAIAQTGDSPLERSFVYAKPRLVATWDAGPDDRLRLSLAREVGQLDFNDFVASASLDRDVVTAGNAALEPDKTWRLTAGWEHRLGADGSITATWTHDEIEDVVDRILVVTPDDAFDAPGNIGSGRRDTLALDLVSSLDRLGLPGGQLRTSVLWRTSEVTDPVTGERRGISDENPVEGSIGVTQDIPALGLTWGLDIEHIAERSVEYRFDEITRESEGMGWTLSVERRIGDRWRLRAEATDLFGRDFHETREKYDGPRSTWPIEEIERRDRETPGFVSLTLRRSTGG